MNLLDYTTELSLAVIATIIAILLIVWQRNKNNTFDLTDALLGEDGKVSLYKIGQAAALVISSWAFIILVQRDKLTEFYFYGYMGVWSGINLAKNLLQKAPDASTDKN